MPWDFFVLQLRRNRPMRISSIGFEELARASSNGRSSVSVEVVYAVIAVKSLDIVALIVGILLSVVGLRNASVERPLTFLW